jgi:hypothetical protein
VIVDPSDAVVVMNFWLGEEATQSLFGYPIIAFNADSRSSDSNVDLESASPAADS